MTVEQGEDPRQDKRGFSSAGDWDRFLSSAIWRDMKELLEGRIKELTEKLLDPTTTPSMAEVRSLQYAIDEVNTLLELPVTTLEELQDIEKHEREERENGER